MDLYKPLNFYIRFTALPTFLDGKKMQRSLPKTFMEVPASMMPLFGRTQYLRGAVVLTLKHTFLSVGLVSFRVAVTTSVNGPEDEKERNAVT